MEWKFIWISNILWNVFSAVFWSEFEDQKKIAEIDRFYCGQYVKHHKMEYKLMETKSNRTFEIVHFFLFNELNID